MEFALASGSYPGSIVAGPDGNLWFSDGTAIGRITPGGQVADFAISAIPLAVGPDGNLWFVDGARMGRLSIRGGVPAVDLEAQLGVEGITAGGDGNLWFADAGRNAVGRLDVSEVCRPGTLCLGLRFEVGATWAGGGSSGTGNPFGVTPNAGAFWFFDAPNLEVFVKILDACRSAGTFNVYVNGLTHLGVTVTVTDKKTGTTKSFVHEDGTPFSLLFDGSTFACP